jgi:outer membrane receptor protein involved in Fe transport
MGRRHLAGASLRALFVALLTSSAALATPAHAQSAAASAASAEINFDIEAQPLATALTEYARQSGLNVLYPYERLSHVNGQLVRGRYTRNGALQLLLLNSGYWASVEGGSVRLIAAPRPQHASSGAETAAADAPIAIPNTGQEETPSSDPAPSATLGDEIVVTGTRVRGPSTSPVVTIGRSEIERSGASTVAQLLQTLPQNFGGGPNETTRTGTGGNNLLAGSSINLRGLGPSSTLVLVNGRRLSTTGTSNGLFVDVSSIPLAAIERVDVLTDGASAIYGSDAIGGVVNFILRDNFNGAQTTARYGAAFDGDAAETAFSQVIGKSGPRGRFLGVYDYYRRDPLPNADRHFAADSNLTSFGGSNFDLRLSNPATVVSPVLAGVPAGQNGVGLTAGQFLIGQPNLQNNNEGQDLFGEQERNSLYLTGAIDLTPSFELFAEARGSDRHSSRDAGGAVASSLIVRSTNPYFVALTPGSTSMTLQYDFIDDLGPIIASGGNQSVSFVGGARAHFGSTWETELTGIWGRERGLYHTANAVNTPHLNEALGSANADPNFNPAIDGYFNPFADGSNSPANVLDYIRGWTRSQFTSKMSSVAFQADGELVQLPAGAVQLAFGGEHRDESYGTRTLEFTSGLVPNLRQTPRQSRDVTAYFIEANVPIVSPELHVPGVERLNLSLAGRHEDTSNGGADTTPKFGLSWTPIDGLDFRASWGRSFRAPALNQTISGSQSALIFPIADPSSPTGTTQTLVLQGTNPNLSSERAQTWTTGFALHPHSWSGFRLELNWFRIAFKDRIATPTSPFTVLTNPTLYAPIITRNPDPALVQSYINAPFFVPLGPVPPASSVLALVDARLRNLSHSLVSGFDLGVSQPIAFEGANLNLFLNASYMSAFRQGFSETGPVVDLVGTASNPLDLKLRGGFTWRRADWDGSVAVNYADAYRDPVANRRIDPLATLDLSLGYEVQRGLKAQFNVRNAFNVEPPFYNNPIGVGYDPENADPVGRFVSLQVTKTW